MGNRILDLGAINGSVSVQIVRKEIKNVHLKVYRTLEVVLSVPTHVSDEWIDTFLVAHKNWIDRQISKYKKTDGFNNLLSIQSGSSTQLLGKDIRVYKEVSLTEEVKYDAKKVIICIRNTEDDALAQQVFESWWKGACMQIFENELEKLYQRIFKKYNLSRPRIIIKRMKTLWGSCTPSKNKITLNEYLLKADLRCIQYVILHELTHLIYPDHSKNFYDFLTIHMPDWQERKQELDHEVVQGL